MKKVIFKKNNYIIVYILLSVIILNSCNKRESKKNTEDKVIAKVKNNQLYLSDINQTNNKEISAADSLILIKLFIDKWASDEVFYQEALNYLTAEEINIDKEIENYRKELITYKFQTKLINEKLDTAFSNEEIETYYNDNSQIFLLKNNIVKVIYVKTPISIPNLDKLKKLCYSTNPSDAEKLNAFCIQYANNFYTSNNSSWLMFDDLKKEIPKLKDVPEYTIQNGKTFEFTDENNFYFLKIIEIKTKNTLSPVNFEKKNIKIMLLNERKQKLINSVKKDFFEKAKSKNEIEIYK